MSNTYLSRILRLLAPLLDVIEQPFHFKVSGALSISTLSRLIRILSLPTNNDAAKALSYLRGQAG